MKIIDELMAGIGRMFQLKEEASASFVPWFKMRVYNDDFLDKDGDNGYFDIDLIAIVRDTISSRSYLVNFAQTNYNDAVMLEDFPHFEQLIPPKLKKGQDPKDRPPPPRTGEQIRWKNNLDVELAVSVDSGTFSGCRGQVELLDGADNIMATFDFKGIENLHLTSCIHIASVGNNKFISLSNCFISTPQFLAAMDVLDDTTEMYAD